jgi:hypothetical protein
MSNIRRLSQLRSAVNIAIGVGLAQEFTDWIVKYNLPSGFLHISAVIVVVITFQLLQFIFNTIFEMSKDVRKILLGREFVEGTWLDLLSHGDTQIAYGVTRIVSSE